MISAIGNGRIQWHDYVARTSLFGQPDGDVRFTRKIIPTTAVAQGQKRILLVMATGTGKTFTAFQIIWRLWRACKAQAV
jgi:excinuclease UvrABC helicase subunit UvrB